MAKRFDASAIDLPQEINAAAWIEWCEDRRERGKPLTQRAAILSINKLRQYAGDVQALMVATAIERGWTGLFPVTCNRPVIGHPEESFIDRHFNNRWREGL